MEVNRTIRDAKYATPDNTIVTVEYNCGRSGSQLSTSDIIKRYTSAGGTIEPYIPPVIDKKVMAAGTLAATDYELARACEDLFKMLVAKNIIAESDIPAKVSERIKQRSAWRAELAK